MLDRILVERKGLTEEQLEEHFRKNQEKYDSRGRGITPSSENASTTKGRFRVMGVATWLCGEYEDAMRSIGFQVQEAVQDSMLSLKVLMDIVTRASGKGEVAELTWGLTRFLFLCKRRA